MCGRMRPAAAIAVPTRSFLSSAATSSCARTHLQPDVASGCVGVTDGDGECVGGVGGELHGGTSGQQHPDHLRYLLFFRGAVTDHRALYRARRVFEDLEPRALRREEHDAARMRELHERFYVVSGERRLDGDRFGLRAGDDGEKSFVDFLQTLRELGAA